MESMEASIPRIEGAGPLDELLLYSATHGRTVNLRDLLKRGAEADSMAGGMSLVAAVTGEHTDCVKMLLHCGANTTDKYGIEAFFMVAQRGDHVLVQSFLDHGARGDTVAGGEALIFAAATGRVKLLKDLLSRGASAFSKEGQMALVMGAQEGHLSCVEELLVAAKMNPPEKACSDALQEASLREHWPIVELLVRLGAEDRCAVKCSAQKGQADSLRKLDDYGVDVSQGLSAAATMGQLDVIKELLRLGTSIVQRGQALKEAVRFGYSDIVLELLDSEVCASDFAIEAMRLARMRAREDIVKLIDTAVRNSD